MVGDVGLVGLVEEQLRLHSDVGVRDVYKLLFQGVMGVKHILGDREGAWRWLREEFESVDVGEFLEEPLLERVSVDGSVVRVNLRSFKRLGLSLEGLFEVMVKSAERIGADKEEFVKVWSGFMELVREGKLDFDYERLREFDEKVKDMGYPPVHHSREYARANKPTYRITHKQTYKEKIR
jgi:hypothetical protein